MISINIKIIIGTNIPDFLKTDNIRFICAKGRSKKTFQFIILPRKATDIQRKYTESFVFDILHFILAIFLLIILTVMRITGVKRVNIFICRKIFNVESIIILYILEIYEYVI